MNKASLKAEISELRKVLKSAQDRSRYDKDELETVQVLKELIKRKEQDLKKDYFKRIA